MGAVIFALDTKVFIKISNLYRNLKFKLLYQLEAGIIVKMAL